MSTRGMKLKKGNYDGKAGGYDYRGANVAGVYNLYKNNKFVKTVSIDTLRKLDKKKK